MSTTENKAEGSSIKKAKRTADRQISKDDDPEEDGEAESSVAGEFQRASEEVLKTRRIVKARVRLPSSSAGAQAAGSANPFRTVVLPSSRPTQDDSTGVVNGTITGSIAASATCSVSGDGVSISLDENSEKSSSPGAVQPTPVTSAKVEEESTSACTGKANEIRGTETQKATGDEGSEQGGEGVESKEGMEGQSALASPSEAVNEKQNGVAEGDEERGGGENGSSISKTETPSSGAFGGGAGSGKVISFEGFGTGSSSFQSLVKGANPLGTSLFFGGFGSNAGTTSATDGAAPLGSSTTSVGNPFSLRSSLASFGTVSTSSSSNAARGNGGGEAKAVGPVVSFGAPAGSGGGFKSFDSVASDGRLWGSSPKGKGVEADAALGETGSKEEATKTSLELMDPSEVVNGEESEECMHRTRAKLFRLAKEEWMEMGIGTIKVLRSAEDVGVINDVGNKGEEGGEGEPRRGKVSSRLVMRREAGQQVILNVALQKQTRCSMNGEKALMIACFTPDGPATYLLKVKTSEDARNLNVAIDALLPEKSG